MMNRRELLRGALGSTVVPRILAAPKIPAQADAFILLFMSGGMAQTETFDPKRYTPYETGLSSSAVLSTFPAKPTVVDGIQLSEGLTEIGKVLDRGTLIRSHRVGDLGHILHAKHQFHWHTGYAPPQPVASPHMGALIARTLGPRHPDVPAFLHIGQNLEVGGESDALKAFHSAGFLGSEYAPFLLPDPRDAVSSVQPPPQFTELRFKNRFNTYKQLLAANPIMKGGSDYQQESLVRSVENAHRFLDSPAAKAFDLSLEPEASYKKYDTGGKFGLG